MEEKQKPQYRNKIQSMLGKVNNDKKVFEPPKKDVVEEIIKNDGVKNGIKKIFKDEVLTESIEEEIEDIQQQEKTNDEVKDVPQFEVITSPQDVPDIYSKWEKAQNYLRRLGSGVDDGATHIIRRVQYGDETEDITIKLVKNNEKENIPYMLVSFGEDEDDTPPELAIPYIQDVGIHVNRDSIFEPENGDSVYFEFDV